MHYFYKINWPKDPMKTSAIWPNLKNVQYKFANVDAKNFLHDDILDWFYSKSMTPDVLVFEYPPNTIGHIHSDGGPKSNICAVNYTLDVVNFKLQWFETTEQPPTTSGNLVSQTSFDAKFFDPNQCRLIAETDEVGPVLINIKVPHRIINLEDKVRRAVSIRFNPCFNLWSEAVNFFQPCIL